MWRTAFVAAIATAILCCAASAATAAVTPGWECVPTTAGQAVVSGGTGAAPACLSGTTAVLAPTYVSAGVGGKPTVAFSTVNVQVISGSGSTDGTVNGEGNLIVGYAEDTSKHPQTGSNNLIVGSENGWKSFGAIVGGFKNQSTGKYATAFGFGNTASGGFSLAAGDANQATGSVASVTGGEHNVAQGNESSVTGGDFNLASGQFASVVSGCENLAGPGATPSGTCVTGAQAVLGGFENTASGLESTVSGGDIGSATGGSASVSGGQFNQAAGGSASVAGGNGNNASGSFASILGGFENSATTFEATVSGGESNSAGASTSSILGGDGNSTSANCEAIPFAPGSC
jgi:hypothetical protein